MVGNNIGKCLASPAHVLELVVQRGDAALVLAELALRRHGRAGPCQQ